MRQLFLLATITGILFGCTTGHNGADSITKAKAIKIARSELVKRNIKSESYIIDVSVDSRGRWLVHFHEEPPGPGAWCIVLVDKHTGSVTFVPGK
ncbi:MAG: hypothetical protein JWM68_3598 [Verrucomicrobiales bacterium]|nr:hypothetical protein [Verrucomicrobiales bacterium]